MDARKKGRIERVAINLLEDHDLSHPGFDIYELLEQLDITCLHKDLGPKIYGASRIQGDQKIISINSENHPNRQRFSAAHELGHILLHQERTLNVSDRLIYNELLRDEKSSEGSDWREIEANHFAACLLMPKDLIEESIEEHGWALDEVDIESIAKKFKVSTIAMSIRLSALGYI